MAGRCERCGSPGSPSGAPASCAACRVPARPSAAGALVAAASWLSAAGRGDPRGDLGVILRGYRLASGLTQQHLADLLGFDRTYISMIECGRRRVTDRGTLTHIARTLAIPPHMLGIVGPNDADFLTMLAFGTSVIRLADAARHGGRVADAVSELWPLITRLEARIAVGQAEPETMRLLARAGDEHTAVGMLSAALSDAETLRLPHQVQRVIRLIGQPGIFTSQPLRAKAEAALTRLDRKLTESASAHATGGRAVRTPPR